MAAPAAVVAQVPVPAVAEAALPQVPVLSLVEAAPVVLAQPKAVLVVALAAEEQLVPQQLPVVVQPLLNHQSFSAAMAGSTPKPRVMHEAVPRSR